MRKVTVYNSVPDFDKLLENLHFEKDSDEADLTKELFDEAVKIAKPKSLFDILPVEVTEEYTKIGDVQIKYPYVGEKLKNTKRAVPYIATCGTELEEWSKTMSDPLEEYIADMIKLQYIYIAATELKNDIRKQYFPFGYLTALNPGSLKRWPLPEQKKLFMMFGEDNVKNDIGVELTQSFLMLPSKSTSGIFFVSEKDYENCMLCPILDCPNRRAPFSGKTE